MKCEICDQESTAFYWTDTHGIGQCSKCGVPYVIYHYEGEGQDRRRIEKEPELAIQVGWIPLLREYWDQSRRIIPGGYSFPGGQELATRADAEAFNIWVSANKHRVQDDTNTTNSAPKPPPEN